MAPFRILKQIKVMDKGNKYPDGYMPKIEYWMKQYQDAVHRFDEMKALEKLHYFIGRELAANK
jgi:hypothetical protein|tara:strand:- start:742 stop:930 length:189 start_codon:yes stop_codon:yes gene_type:complete